MQWNASPPCLVVLGMGRSRTARAPYFAGVWGAEWTAWKRRGGRRGARGPGARGGCERGAGLFFDLGRKSAHPRDQKTARCAVLRHQRAVRKVTQCQFTEGAQSPRAAPVRAAAPPLEKSLNGRHQVRVLRRGHPTASHDAVWSPVLHSLPSVSRVRRVLRRQIQIRKQTPRYTSFPPFECSYAASGEVTPLHPINNAPVLQ